MLFNKALVTFLMFNLLSTLIYFSVPAQAANTDFDPVYPAQIEQSTPAIVPYNNEQVQEVMFYIPVYTMKVKQNKETPAIVPAAVKPSNNVIMPIYNHVNVQKNKSALNPSSGSSGWNNPVVNPVPPSNPNGSEYLPKPPDNTIGSGSDNSGGHSPVPPDNSISANGSNPSISTPNLVLPQQPAPQNITSKKSHNIIAAAPIVMLQGASFKKGTKLKVKSCEELTSNKGIYKRIEFETIEPVSTTYATIPIGTKIIGEIIKIEKPRNFCRSAVVMLLADKMMIGGETYTVDGIVTKTDERKVYFNKVKAPSSIKSAILAHTAKGRDYYRKMVLKSKDFAGHPKTIFLAPFPYIAGAAGIVSNAAVSPFAVIRKKGEEVYLAQGTEYELKFDSDCNLPVKSNIVSYIH